MKGNCSQTCARQGCVKKCERCTTDGPRIKSCLSDKGSSIIEQLVDDLTDDSAVLGTAPSWVAAVKSAADALQRAGFPAMLADGIHQYATLQPCRSMAFALPIPDPATWSSVTLGELAAVSPDKNGFFAAGTFFAPFRILLTLTLIAVASLRADTPVSKVAAAMSETLGCKTGDPRLWSCHWCQCGLKSKDAVMFFKTTVANTSKPKK